MLEFKTAPLVVMLNRTPKGEPGSQCLHKRNRLSYPLQMNFRKPSMSSELPKRIKTSRCGGVASAFSIKTKNVAVGQASGVLTTVCAKRMLNM